MPSFTKSFPFLKINPSFPPLGSHPRTRISKYLLFTLCEKLIESLPGGRYKQAPTSRWKPTYNGICKGCAYYVGTVRRRCFSSFGYVSESVCVLVAQSFPTLCSPTHYSPAGSSVHGILQVRILGWIDSLSRGIFLTWDLLHYR